MTDARPFPYRCNGMRALIASGKQCPNSVADLVLRYTVNPCSPLPAVRFRTFSTKSKPHYTYRHPIEDDMARAVLANVPKKYTTALNARNPRLPKEQCLVVIKNYIKALVELPCCVDIRKRPTGCTCLRENLSDGIWLGCIAEWLYDFYRIQSPTFREGFVFDKLRMSRLSQRFPLPAFGQAADATGATPTICKNSYFGLLCVRQYKLEKMQQELKTANRPRVHRGTGKPGNHSLKIGITAALHVFFEEMVQLASPRATRFIRLETGIDARDDDTELIELPSHWSGRNVYYKFCAEVMGFNVIMKSDNGGYRYEIIEAFNSHILDANGDPHKPPALTTFLAFWTKHYPKLVIPRAREDICNECFIFAHSFRYYSEPRMTHTAPTKNDIVNDFENREKMVEQARLHVKRAEAQRRYFNSISKAIDDDSEVLVMDFMQNLGIPYLGSEQSGATYYYSPLTVNVFGVVNMKTDLLHVFCYDEGEGANGGNNVASMVMEYLTIYNMLRHDENNKPVERKSLKIVMDNCSGQNKVKAFL